MALKRCLKSRKYTGTWKPKGGIRHCAFIASAHINFTVLFVLCRSSGTKRIWCRSEQNYTVARYPRLRQKAIVPVCVFAFVCQFSFLSFSPPAKSFSTPWCKYKSLCIVLKPQVLENSNTFMPLLSQLKLVLIYRLWDASKAELA